MYNFKTILCFIALVSVYKKLVNAAPWVFLTAEGVSKFDIFLSYDQRNQSIFLPLLESQFILLLWQKL